MRAVLIYHLSSGRFIRESSKSMEDVTLEEAEMARESALGALARAMIQSAGHGRQQLVPVLTMRDERGRDHLIPTHAIEDVEVVLEDDPPDTEDSQPPEQVGTFLTHSSLFGDSAGPLLR